MVRIYYSHSMYFSFFNKLRGRFDFKFFLTEDEQTPFVTRKAVGWPKKT